MLDVIDQILAETALFVVVMRGHEWVETTLIRRAVPTDVPQLGPNLHQGAVMPASLSIPTRLGECGHSFIQK
jgi:hypothetical protein